MSRPPSPSWISVPFLLRRPSKIRQMEERNAEARGNLKPVLAFVKIVRGVAAEIEPKKSEDRSTRHCGASKRTWLAYGPLWRSHTDEKHRQFLRREPRRGIKDALV